MKLQVRSMIIAPPGKQLISVDLSQAESWVVAFESGDENMKWSLQNSDIHTDTAAVLFLPPPLDQHRPKWKKIGDNHVCEICGDTIEKSGRYIGKRWNHATSYQMKPPRAAEVVNKDSDKPPFVTVTIKQARAFSEAWLAHYKRVPLWWIELKDELNRNNRKLVTAYGRERKFYQIWGDELFKEATAFKPQSTVGDHFNGMVQPELGIKGGLSEIYRQLVKPYPNEHRIINQAHDSCILEVPKIVANEIALNAKNLLKRPLMIKGETFTIPVDAEIGDRWGELEKV